MAFRIVQTKNYANIAKMDMICFPNDELENVKQSNWFVGYLDGELACYAGLHVNDKEFAFLSRAGVLEEYRGNRFQDKLIKARLRYAKKIGLRIVYTYVLFSNHRSLNALVNCGFRAYQPEYNYAGDKDFIYLRKVLR